MRRAIPGCLLLLALAACRHAPPPRIDGTSSFTFVEPPQPPPSAKPSGDLDATPRQSTEMLLLARPIEPLAKPVYPSVALGRETMPVVIGVQITVDVDGRVAHVRTSLAVMSTPTPRAAEFRAAVEDALAQWRFRPAELRRLAPATDATGAPTWTLASREKSECVYDVSFVFQSSGEVVARELK
jgi:hypothetical protein